MGTDDHPTARLRVVAPRGVQWALDLPRGSVTLGRAPDDGSPPVPHHTVSRLHARISWDADRGEHVVEDLRSRHGTDVDGDVASPPVSLRDGAILRLGGVFLAYEQDRGAPRRGDIPGRLDDLWRQRAAALPLPELTSASYAVLLAHPWSDELLERLVDDLATRTASGPIDRADLPAWAREEAPTERRPTFTPPVGVKALRLVPPPIKPRR